MSVVFRKIGEQTGGVALVCFAAGRPQRSTEEARVTLWCPEVVTIELEVNEICIKPKQLGDVQFLSHFGFFSAGVTLQPFGFRVQTRFLPRGRFVTAAISVELEL